MVRLGWTGLVVAAILVALVTLWVVWNPDRAIEIPLETAASTPSKSSLVLPFKGTASCSSFCCHGGMEPVAKQSIRHDEYTRWMARDKHAQSYQTLLSTRSRRIIERLDGDKPAHQEPRCLSCHTNPLTATPEITRHLEKSPESELSQFVREERAFGIGCEACHGAAHKWLDPHVSQWQEFQGAQKSRQRDSDGLKRLNEPITLARTCVGCHVGSPPGPEVAEKRIPERDVNHDLIAAGHPRLYFELTAFLTNLPSHWDKPPPRPPPHVSEAQLWMVGQATSAEAALQLLAHRSSVPERWPEFAEFDCFSCHHDLQEPSWRQQRDYQNRPPGSFAWNNWYYAMPRALSKQPLRADLKQAIEGVNNLECLMSHPTPKRHEVQNLAQAAAKHFEAQLPLLCGTTCDPPTLRRLLLGLTEEGQERTATDWDSAAQLYLALVALDKAYQEELRRSNRQPTEQDRRIEAAIQALARHLTFAAAERPNSGPKPYAPIKADNRYVYPFRSELRGLTEELRR